MKALSISPFFIKYIATWASFCLVAVFILVWDRKRLPPEWREYVSFLSVPWKLCLFAPALLFVTIAGRYFRLSFVRADWPKRPVDTRFAPLILVSVPFIVIAAFVLVAFVGWNLGMFRR